MKFLARFGKKLEESQGIEYNNPTCLAGKAKTIVI
jgi:hypothetical protein